MTITDPFDLLSTLNPMPELSEALGSDEALLASILAGREQPVTIRRGRRRAGWIVGGTAVVAVALAANALSSRDEPSDPRQIACFSEVSASPMMQVGLPISPDPLAACAQAWAAGGLGGDGSVPALVACVSDHGIIAVLPGDIQSCARVGYGVWSGELSAEAQQLTEFSAAISEHFEATCIVEADAEAVAGRFLADHGIEGWSVAINGKFSPERRCSRVSVDPELRLLAIGSRPGTP